MNTEIQKHLFHSEVNQLHLGNDLLIFFSFIWTLILSYMYLLNEIRVLCTWLYSGIVFDIWPILTLQISYQTPPIWFRRNFYCFVICFVIKNEKETEHSKARNFIETTSIFLHNRYLHIHPYYIVNFYYLYNFRINLFFPPLISRLNLLYVVYLFRKIIK